MAWSSLFFFTLYTTHENMGRLTGVIAAEGYRRRGYFPQWQYRGDPLSALGAQRIGVGPKAPAKIGFLSP
jgi:hypothetical protein